MNPFKKLGSWFVVFGKLSGHALQAAAKHGLTDEILNLALIWVKQAAKQQLDSAGRREWVVEKLRRAHIDESVARLATELALQIAREQVAKL